MHNIGIYFRPTHNFIITIIMVVGSIFFFLYFYLGRINRYDFHIVLVQRSIFGKTPTAVL